MTDQQPEKKPPTKYQRVQSALALLREHHDEILVLRSSRVNGRTEVISTRGQASG
jgi:hypothetical protein